MYYRGMDTSQAIDAFSALALETRLTVFRLLIKEGDQFVSGRYRSTTRDTAFHTHLASPYSKTLGFNPIYPATAKNSLFGKYSGYA